MSDYFAVTVACGSCAARWETWGISWERPASNDWPGGTWVLGQSCCQACGEEQQIAVQSVNNDLASAAPDPSLTPHEREN